MKPGRAWPLLAFLLALLPRLFFFFEWNRAGLLNLPVVDAATFDGEARALLAGTWPGAEPFWQAPLYSFFLGGLYRLFGWSWPTARLVQALIGAGSCVLVLALARRRLPERWARVAFGIACLYGPLLYFEGQLLRETLGTFLLLLWALLDEIDRARPRLLRAMGAGLALGLATLCRENLLLLLPLALLLRLWKREVRAARAAAAMLIGFALAVTPVTVHNARTAHAFIPISTSGGINLFLANNADARHTLAIRPGREWTALVARPWRETRRAEEIEASRFFYRAATRWMVDQPGAFLAGLLRKGLDLCAAREVKRNLDLYEARGGSRLLAILLWKIGPFGFPFGLVGPLALLGLGWRFRRDPLAWVVLLIAAGVVLFFPSARHRLPMIPFLVILAAAALEELVRRWREARGSLAGPGVALVLCLALALLGGGPLGATDLPPAPAEPHFLRGTALAALARDREAVTELQQAVRIDPRHEEAWADLAVLFGRGGDLARAEEAATRAVAIDSTFAEAWSDLASVEAARGDTARAEASYRHALRLEPDLTAAAVGLGRLLERARLDDAIAVLRAARDEAPKEEELALLLAALESRRGDTAGAARTLESLLATRPRNADAWNNLGIARAQLGRREEARAAFQRALAIAPAHASARRNLERIEAGR